MLPTELTLAEEIRIHIGLILFQGRKVPNDSRTQLWIHHDTLITFEPLNDFIVAAYMLTFCDSHDGLQIDGKKQQNLNISTTRSEK